MTSSLEMKNGNLPFELLTELFVGFSKWSEVTLNEVKYLSVLLRGRSFQNMKFWKEFHLKIQTRN